MRPCQHCGSAILLTESVCPECGGEQVATVGVGKNEVASPQVADDRSVEERQVQVQHEAESWMLRTFFILTASINGGLILLGYLLGGVEGIRLAMFIVTASVVFTLFLFAVVFNGAHTTKEVSVGALFGGLMDGGLWVRLIILLGIVNGVGAFLLPKLQ